MFATCRYSSRLLALLALGVALGGCGRPLARKPAPKPEYVALTPQETQKLSEVEFLMRKSTVGSRPERLEALSVLDRMDVPQKLPFFLERLQKEDDQFLRVQIIRSLVKTRDIRAVEALRGVAKWDVTRAAIEAIHALYQLGDDSYVPRLIRFMRQPEDYGDLAAAAQRTLVKIYGVHLGANQRLWNAYYHSHRLAQIAEQERWYNPAGAPLPPVEKGTTRVAQPSGPPTLPQAETRLRRTVVSYFDFWKPDLP